jgi:hypothetical protein
MHVCVSVCVCVCVCTFVFVRACRRLLYARKTLQVKYHRRVGCVRDEKCGDDKLTRCCRTCGIRLFLEPISALKRRIWLFMF